MVKRIGLFLIAFTLFFCGAFYSVNFQEGEDPSVLSGNLPESGEFSDGTGNAVTQDPPVNDGQVLPEWSGGDTPDTGNQTPEQVNFEEPTAEPVIYEEPTAEPAAAPVWAGLSEDQVMLLKLLYDEMTQTGKYMSGWFLENNYSPCSWSGITCGDEGNVIGLSFENAGYFTTFPESILSFRELKELRMADTLVRGMLPETLFADLPKLEKLELSGNFFTGTIPELPEYFEVYPVLEKITISDNREDERKSQLLYRPEYTDLVNFTLDPYEYPDIDLTPGLDGNIPDNWDRLLLLSEIDLSGNTLTGEVPQSFAQLPLSSLDLRENSGSLTISQDLYNYLLSFGNSDIILDELILPAVSVQEPEPVEEPGSRGLPADSQPEDQDLQLRGEPVSEHDLSIQANPVNPDTVIAEQPMQVPVEIVPTEIPTQEPVVIIPTEVPPVIIPTEIPTQVPPTDAPVIPTAVPTQVPPTPQTIIIVVTATPVPQYYTATPASYYPTQQPYYYPTATPYTYQYQQPYYYPTTAPYTYPNQQPYYYPTATPYTYYNPNWVYPTATSAYSYPQYVQLQSPTQVPTMVPTQDQAALLGFTYKLEAMTENNIPMTWRYTGMTDYSINYLDASGNIYPGFAMEWTPAADLCNASACNATVSVPDELLKQGKFALQLRTRDASGKTYVSDAVEMEVSTAQTAPTPEPEQPKSFLAGFFEWLFGPLIRLFGGK